MWILSKYTDEQVEYQIERLHSCSAWLFPFYYIWMTWVFRRSEKGADACYREWEEKVKENIKMSKEIIELLRKKVKESERMLETKANWRAYVAEKNGLEYKPGKDERQIADLIENIKKHLDCADEAAGAFEDSFESLRK